jgi:hypothetical protein
VYFISDGTAIKIGVSTDPSRRVKGLQTSHHRQLQVLATIPGGYEKEAELHGIFASTRLAGEWFEDTPELRAYISQAAKPMQPANDNADLKAKSA